MNPIFRRIAALCRDVLDALIPPRESQRSVRTFARSEAEALMRLADSRYRGARSLLPYRHPRVKALIKELKYRRDRRALLLAADLLGEECLGIASELLAPPLLIAVPMHGSEKRARGFNQTDELCKTIADRLGEALRYEPTGLERARKTLPQRTLPRRARLRNVKDSMRADSALVRGRVCIVIDDVTTTGATFAEARRALEKAGASAVHCVALAG